MATIGIIAIVLVAIYAIKAVSIVRSHNELAEKSAAFSWVAPEQRDEAAPAPWQLDEAATARKAHVARPAMRRTPGFSA